MLHRPKFDRYVTMEEREAFITTLALTTVVIDIVETIQACRVSEVTLFDWQLLYQEAFIYGLVLSLTITIFMVISGAIALDAFVDSYPPEIQRKYGAVSPQAIRLRPYFAVLLFSLILIIPLLGLGKLQTEHGSITFLPALVFSGIVLFVFNTYDLLILDLFLFCTIQPSIMVLPGTKGMAAYRDYRFHFIGFLKGLGFNAVGSLVIAIVWIVLQWFISALVFAA